MQSNRPQTKVIKGYPIVSVGCKGRIEAGAHKNIAGIGTINLKTCLGVIVVGDDKISLTHATIYNTPDNLLDEIKWVENPSQIIFVKNEEEIKKANKFYKQLNGFLENTSENKKDSVGTDYLKNWEALLESRYPKIKKNVINTATGEVYISLAGEISTQNSPQKPIVVLADLLDNNFWGAINYLNSVYSGKTDHLTPLEFDRNKLLAMPELSPRVRGILTTIKNDLKGKSVTTHTIDASLKVFEEYVRGQGKYIEMLEESFVRPRVLKEIEVILARSAFRTAPTKPSALLGYCGVYHIKNFDQSKQKLIIDQGGNIEKEEKQSVCIKIQSDKLNKAVREKLGIDRVCISTTSNIEKKQHDYLSLKKITIEPTTHPAKFFATFPAEKKKLVETVVKYSSSLFAEKKAAKNIPAKKQNAYQSIFVQKIQRRWREKHPIQATTKNSNVKV